MARKMLRTVRIHSPFPGLSALVTLVTMLTVTVLLSACTSENTDKSKTKAAKQPLEALEQELKQVQARSNAVELTPELFLKMNLALRQQEIRWTKEWLKRVRRQRRAFFTSLGLESSTLEKYRKQHQQEIEAYLEKNRYTYRVINYKKATEPVTRRKIYYRTYQPLSSAERRRQLESIEKLMQGNP